MSSNEFNTDYYSGFDKKFNHVLKKFKRSFSKDFDRVVSKVILNGIKERGINNIPKTKRISGLGEEIKLPVLKTHIYIADARDDCGRVIYLIDAERGTLFFIDVYYKSEQENHDVKIINDAYVEYISKSGI